MRKLVYILFLGILVACDGEDPKATCEQCREDLICTREFRTLSFMVNDTAGEPIVLDDLEVTTVETGEVLYSSDAIGQLLPGSYIIAQDSDLD